MQTPRRLWQRSGTHHRASHGRRTPAATFAAMTLLAALGACGGPDAPSSSAASPAQARAAARAGLLATALAATYVPAAPTCSAMAGPAALAPSPVAGGTTHVSGYRVCGPFAAARGLSSFTCLRPGGAVGPFRLLVYNGNPDGTARSSSAVVRVDGLEVLGHQVFDQQIGAATARIPLAAANVIETAIQDEGGSLRLEVVDEGQACSILRPVDVGAAGLQTTLSSPNASPVPELQLFNGGLDGLSPTNKGEVSFDGAPLVARTEIREKVTAVLRPLPLAPPNTLSAAAGNRGYFSLQVVDRDETPPRFTVEVPADGSYTNRTPLPVSGTIDDPSATVTVNGVVAAVAGSRYTGQASLVECWNTITVTARDTCGNASEATVRVGLDTVPPVLAILAPLAGLVTNQPQQPVSLRYSDNFSGVDLSSLRVSLDDADVTGRLAIGADTATGSILLSEGRHTLHARISDRAGNVTAQDSSFIVDLTPPTLTIAAPRDGSTVNQLSVAVTITYSDALAGVDLTTLAVSLDGKDVTKNMAAGPVSAAATLTLAAGPHQLDVQIADLAGNVARARSSFTVTGTGGLPPDPRTVAPPTDPTVATDIASATAFLYSGPNPIQTGMAPGTIEARRAAVIRGQVRERDGNPAGGVRVTVLDHPEFGSTLTRADGMFDMAVNGGGVLTVNYQKDGYLPAQRQVQTPWRDYARAEEVVLVPFDTQVTPIAMGAAQAQLARGSRVTDVDGSRQATILFPPGTQASMVMADGSAQQLAAMHVRATEYTVGSSGQSAMPAKLPPATGYTYAVELSVDEAVMAGARGVAFDRPVPVYLENFLATPTGWPIPSGYYDRERGAWVPSDDGRVIKILSLAAGVPEIDADGDGVADTAASLAELGFTPQELQMLAATYPAGQTLWRIRVAHFTTYDFNFTWGCRTDSSGRPVCLPPEAGDPVFGVPREKCPDSASGSLIECQSQILGESASVAGTPFSLNYRSDWQLGRMSSVVTIHLPSSTPQAAMGLALEVYVAGQYLAQTLPVTQTGTITYVWDRRDAYGRPVRGSAPVVVRLGYVYSIDAVLVRNGAGAGFGAPGGISYDVPGGPTVWPRTLAPSSHFRTSPFFVIWKTWTSTLENWTASPLGLGGWTLSEHHSYSPDGRVLRFGDGSTMAAGSMTSTISTVVGGGIPDQRDGIPATQASFQPAAIAFGPDGSLFVAEWGGRVRKVDTAGIITTVAGGGSLVGPSAEGVLATSVSFQSPIADIALAPDGALFIVGYYASKVWRVGPDGLIRTFAGGGMVWPADGGPATQARLNITTSVAVGPDRAVYIMEGTRLRRVGTDGIITTVGGVGYSDADGIPATQARMPWSGKVSVGRDGSIYLGGLWETRVRRIGPDGIINTFAGTQVAGFAGDGGPAAQAQLNGPNSALPLADGSVVIADSRNCRIRLVSPSGDIRTIAGSGTCYGPVSPCWAAGDPGWGDGKPARDAPLNMAAQAGVGPDGALYIADMYVCRVRKVAPALPGAAFGDTFVASDGGREVHHFDAMGRHLETLDGRTRTALRRFGYDGAGLLSSITDSDGNVTAIERGINGSPLAIVAPHGQRTVLSTDANGYLSVIANPAGETARYGYDANGMMLSYTTPRGDTHAFMHDSMGRLVSDANPAGGRKTLARVDRSDGFAVTMTTALGRATAYDVQEPATKDRIFTTTAPDGTVARRTEYASGGVAATSPDGTTTQSTFGPDPRFGMEVPVVSTTVRTPLGLSSSVAEGRTATLSDPRDPLSATVLGETLAVNWRTYATTYTSVNRTSVSATPAGRTVTSVLDDKGRIVQLQPPGVRGIQLQYDTSGRLSTVTQGTRSYAIAYDALGYPRTITDPLSRTVYLTHDPVGRVTTQTLPGGRTVTFGYDANGNLTSLAPPGRPAHGFGYTSIDLTASYMPPTVPGAGLLSTTYGYDLDAALAQVLLPDQSSIVPGYDAAGRLASVTTARGTTALGYDAAGRISTVTAPDGGGLAYTYDGFLKTSESWSGTVGGQVSWTYDNDFRVASSSVNGAAVSYQYDPDSLLTAAGALAIAREPATGRVSGTTLGAVATSQGYDEYGELASFGATAGGSSAYSYSLTRDLAGRITGKTETVQGATDSYAYGYDDAGRLATVTRNGQQTASYVYDPNGNRLQKTTQAGSELGGYDDQDRMYAYGGATYAYRPNGELAGKTVGGQTTSYDYDALGNLRALALPDGRIIEYVIDGLNRRVGKKVNGVLAEGFLYDGQLRPLAWLDGTGAVKARFVYGTRVNVPEYMVTAAGTYRIVTDHLGSPRLAVNATTGAIAQRVDYDEWGVALTDTNPGFQPFGFAGGLFDRDTGLVRFGARDYDPQTGRWTNKDPIRFAGGLNLYAYVDNDPLNFIDPSGLFNPTKGLAAILNVANSVRLAAGGTLKLLAAGGLIATGEGAPPGIGVAAWGSWNLYSSTVAWRRGTKEWGEAFCEGWSDASWRNLLGVLPFGDKYDDPNEPTLPEFFVKKFQNLEFSLKHILELIGELGTNAG